MEECLWTPETPDACIYCSGVRCNVCGFFTFRDADCNHDSFERHMTPTEYADREQ